MSIIDYAVQKSANTDAENLETHIIYAGNYYHHDFIVPQLQDNYLNKEKLRRRVLRKMKKHKLRSAMVTSLHMKRLDFITKEKMNEIRLGTKNWFDIAKESVNDDLDKFFESLQRGRDWESKAWTHFLPKLTNRELELFENKDEDFFETCLFSLIEDVNNEDSKLTDSDSMFIEGFCLRHTIRIENPTIQEHSKTRKKPKTRYICFSI